MPARCVFSRQLEFMQVENRNARNVALGKFLFCLSSMSQEEKGILVPQKLDPGTGFLPEKM